MWRVHKRCRHYLVPGEVPLKFNTRTHYGCPYDCGLCPDHEQHSCLTLIEVTDRCNLECPICYASSGPGHGRHRTLEEIERMLDVIVANEPAGRGATQWRGAHGASAVLRVLDAAKRRPVRHLMMNTNGIRIAKDRAFVERLAGYMPDFEIYLQFDSFKPEVLKRMRGEDLTGVRQRRSTT